MYQCAISCCQDETYNMESMERCVENCSKELQFAHNFLENELNKWQVRALLNEGDLGNVIGANEFSSDVFSGGPYTTRLYVPTFMSVERRSPRMFNPPPSRFFKFRWRDKVVRDEQKAGGGIRIWPSRVCVKPAGHWSRRNFSGFSSVNDARCSRASTVTN